MGMRKVTIISYDCPSCGASVKIDANASKATCEYCGNQFVIEQEKTQTSNVPPTNARYQPSRKVMIFIPIIVVAVLFTGIFMISLFSGVLMEIDGARKDNKYEQKIDKIDPFKDIEVVVEGKEPWAEITSITSNDPDVRGTKYTVDKDEGLSNGDVVTITVGDPSIGQEWTKTTYEYTISGLDTLVTDLTQIKEEDREMIFQVAKEELVKDWKDNLDYANYTPEDVKLDIQEGNMYLSLYKENKMNAFSEFNFVWATFTSTMEADGKTYTYYHCVDISNVYYSPDGKIHGDFNLMDGSNGFLFNNELDSTFMLAVHGFESELKMEADMEKDNFTLIK